jgi:hypothetical protein
MNEIEENVNLEIIVGTKQLITLNSLETRQVNSNIPFDKPRYGELFAISFRRIGFFNTFYNIRDGRFKFLYHFESFQGTRSWNTFRTFDLMTGNYSVPKLTVIWPQLQSVQTNQPLETESITLSSLGFSTPVPTDSEIFMNVKSIGIHPLTGVLQYFFNSADVGDFDVYVPTAELNSSRLSPVLQYVGFIIDDETIDLLRQFGFLSVFQENVATLGEIVRTDEGEFRVFKFPVNTTKEISGLNTLIRYQNDSYFYSLKYLPNFYGSPTLSIYWNATSCNLDSANNFTKSGIITRVPVLSSFGQYQSYTEQNPMVYLLEETNITNISIEIVDEERQVDFGNLPVTMELATCLVRDLTKINSNQAPGSSMNPIASVREKMQENITIDQLTGNKMMYRNEDFKKRMRL